MKTLALIARKKGTSRESFREHYEAVHAPLAIATMLEGTTRYVRHHVTEEVFGTPSFDVVTAFWYRDVEAALAVSQRLAGPAGEAILADELTFMDKPANTFFAVSEHPVMGSEDPGAALRALALVRAPAGEEASRFLADYETKQVPRLLEAVRAPTWCLQNRVQAFSPEAPAFDAVTQLHAAGDLGLAEWARGLAATGASVRVFAASEHESALPWTAA